MLDLAVTFSAALGNVKTAHPETKERPIHFIHWLLFPVVKDDSTNALSGCTCTEVKVLALEKLRSRKKETC